MSRNMYYYTSLERVMRAISLANNLSLTVSNCIISKPSPVAGTWKENTTTKNTVVKISQVEPAVTYNGRNWVTYDRVHISDMLRQLPNFDTLRVDNPKTTQDLLRAINRRWGYGLESTDIVTDPITLDENGKATVTMVMHPDSLLYVGSHTFSIVPGDAMLSENVTTTVQPGFVYPDGSMDYTGSNRGYAQPYSYSYDFTTKSTELHAMQVGTTLTGLADVFKYITGTTWTNTGSDADNSLTFDGAEILYNGLNSTDYPTSSAYKYVMIVKMGSKSKLVGKMYVQYNDKDDPNAPK